MIINFKFFENQKIDTKNNQILIDLYNDFNKQYFNNQLPKNLIIRWFRSKNSGGVAKAKFIRNRYGVTITEITELVISNYRPLSDDKLKGIMLHEMIHIYLYTQNVVYTKGRDKTHGYEFMSKLNELQKKVKFEIPLTEDSMEISDDIKSKTFDVLFYIDKSSIAFSVYSENYLLNNKDNLIKKWEYTLTNRRKREDVEMVVYQSNDRDLLNYKCKRNLNTLTFYSMDKDKYETLIKNAKKIYEF